MTNIHKPFRFLFGIAISMGIAFVLMSEVQTTQASQVETHVAYLPVIINQAALNGTESTESTLPAATPPQETPAPPVSTPPATTTPTATANLTCDSETTLTLKVEGQYWGTSITSIYWNNVIQGQIMPQQDGQIKASFRHYQPQNGRHTIRIDDGENEITIEADVSCLTVSEPQEPQPEPEPMEPVLPDLLISKPTIVGEWSSETAVTVTVTITNNSDLSLYKMIFIDLFIDPATVAEDHIPLVESDAFLMITSIDAHESRVLTFTLLDGLPQDAALIYAMIDTAQIIDEADEQNNVSTPLPLTK